MSKPTKHVKKTPLEEAEEPGGFSNPLLIRHFVVEAWHESESECGNHAGLNFKVRVLCNVSELQCDNGLRQFFRSREEGLREWYRMTYVFARELVTCETCKELIAAGLESVKL